VQPGLRHQSKQPGRLERHRLSAGVRTGDEQDRCGGHDFDRDRNGPFRYDIGSSVRQAPFGKGARCFFQACHHFRHQQRMTRGLQLEGAVARELRLDAVHERRKARARLEHVELGGRFDRAV
jgi:hypothetical protein